MIALYSIIFVLQGSAWNSLVALWSILLSFLRLGHVFVVLLGAAGRCRLAQLAYHEGVGSAGLALLLDDALALLALDWWRLRRSSQGRRRGGLRLGLEVLRRRRTLEHGWRRRALRLHSNWRLLWSLASCQHVDVDLLPGEVLLRHGSIQMHRYLVRRVHHHVVGHGHRILVLVLQAFLDELADDGSLLDELLHLLFKRFDLLLRYIVDEVLLIVASCHSVLVVGVVGPLHLFVLLSFSLTISLPVPLAEILEDSFVLLDVLIEEVFVLHVAPDGQILGQQLPPLVHVHHVVGVLVLRLAR